MSRSTYDLDMPHGDHWTARAYCRQLISAGVAQADDWYPKREAADDPEVKRAKRRCRSCHVRQECLDDALARNERFGIAGGLTARERRALDGAAA